MPLIKKILVPTDFSPYSERALSYAAQLAAAGTEVVLLHVFAFPYDWYYWDIEGLELLKKEVEENAWDQLERLASTHSRPRVTITPRLVVHSHVSRAIFDAMKEEAPDLVVIGTKGWRADLRLELGSVAEQLARRIDVPVLVVPDLAKGLSEAPNFLVPLYASEVSADALQIAGTFAELFDGQINILHVLPQLPFGAPFLGNEPVEAGDLLEPERRLKQLKKFAARNLRPGVSFVVHLEEGELVENVVDFVDAKGADIVVLARSDAADRPHKAEMVARQVGCPVLIVPPSILPPTEGATSSSAELISIEASP